MAIIMGREEEKEQPIRLNNQHEEIESLQNQQEEKTESVSNQKEDTESSTLWSLEEVEGIIGYNFKDPSLLQEAFTDNSFKAETCSSYERLEYLGDSVLGLLIAKEHIRMYPKLGPGELTRLRAANVDKEKLGRAALNHNLHKYLRHKKPLLHAQIRVFKKAIADYPLHSTGLIDAPKALSDIVESTIGAVFLDSNSSLETTWKVVENLLQPLITPATIQPQASTSLHELCQKKGFELYISDSWSETGEFEVYIDKELVGRGAYREKRSIALNRAAKNAHDEMVRRDERKQIH